MQWVTETKGAQTNDGFKGTYVESRTPDIGHHDEIWKKIDD
jgi:hypothetical protein